MAGALLSALLLLAACSRQESSFLLLGGDVMLSRGGTAIFEASLPWEEIASYLDENRSAAFAVNLESPFGDVSSISDAADSEMNLCADETGAGILKDGGIDIVTTANNHRWDCPVSDKFTTASVVESAGIQSFEESQVSTFTNGGQTVAVIALDAYTGDFEIGKIKEDIKSSREKSDLVVVSVHWGIEYQAGPSIEQENLAQELVDAGADLVWGHHPHVLQRMEWRESFVDGHKALVMYSLGNLLADQWMLADTMRTVLVRIKFVPHEIKEIEILPLQMDLSSKKLRPVTQHEVVEGIIDRLGLDDMSKDGVRIELTGN